MWGTCTVLSRGDRVGLLRVGRVRGWEYSRTGPIWKEVLDRSFKELGY